MRTRYLLLFLALFCWGFVGAGMAWGQDDGQRYSLVLRGVHLNEALEELARVTEIDLIYSSELVSDLVAYCNGRDMPAERLLQCILAESGLDYVRSSAGTYVIIESLEDSPLFGHVAGRVVDDATGAPLPYANVLLADAAAGTTTDAAGLFSFASVLSGSHRLFVTYVGYETAVDSVRIEPGSRNRLEIGLTRSTLSMEPIVVDGLTQRLPSRALGTGTLAVDDRLTGAIGTPDVARAAAGMSGVSIRHPLADLHIQGDDAGEHLTLLDGAPVRDPVTLGRHLSAFSPLAIQRITVHKAGFGASHGSHLSGVIEVEHDVSIQGSSTATVHVDPVSVSGKAEGKVSLSNDRNAVGMISLRSSMWDVFRDPGLESLLDRWNAVDPIFAGIWIREPVTTESLAARRHLPDLAFTDLHGAARAEITPFSTLHASAFRATNRIGSELAIINADDASELDRMMLTRDEYDWTNWAGQVRYTWLANARSAMTLQLLASGNTSSYRYLSLYEDVPSGTRSVEPYAEELRPSLEGFVGSGEVNTIHEYTARATYSRSLAPDRHLDVSLEATNVDSWFELGNHFVAPFSHAADAWHVTGYAEGRLSVGLHTTIEPGTRLTYLPERQTFYAEPRLAVRFDRPTHAIGHYALRVAGGLYRQFIPSFSLTSSGPTSAVPFVRFWLPSDRSMAPPRSYHLSAEALFLPSDRWTASVEAYRKWHPRLLTVDYVALLQNLPAVRPRPDPTPLDQSDFIAATTGRSLGGSIRLAYRTARHAASLRYGYSLSERRYPDRFEDRLLPVPWNEPHRLAAEARYGITSNLSIHVDAETTWGRRWALRRTYYDYLAPALQQSAFPPFDLDHPEKHALPAYLDLDLGLTYDLSVRPLTVRVSALIANVFDRHNVYDWSLEASGDRYRTVDRSLPGRRPVLSIRLAY
ncbi:MAG: carboxypeptidase-like regulatory domain-containing protein [Rhodothermales bacterium]